MPRPALALLLALSACGPALPAEGGVYEDTRTGERVEVRELGSCEEMARAAEQGVTGAASQLRMMVNAGSISAEDVLAVTPSVRPAALGNGDECALISAVAPTAADSLPVITAGPRWYQAVGVEEFARDFAPVE
jgi:hypothetical protein